MKKITLLAAAAFISICSQAQSFSGLYAFDSVKTTSGISDPSPLPTATGVAFGAFSATGTPTNPNATGRFSFTDWALGAANGETVYANLTGAVNTGEYYEVTVTPAAGYTISLGSITFSFGRSGTGVRTYAVRSDADAYAANLPASISPANPNLSVQTGDVFFLNTDITTTSQNGSTITLSGASFSSLSAARTFRFYGWNAEGTGGTFSIDNVTITGNAVVDPSLTAGFTGTNVCFGTPTAFMDMTTGPNPIVSYAWSFGDGTGTSTLQNPSYLYGAPGNYQVTLVVVDNLLNTDTYMDSVHVYALPVAGFSVTNMCNSAFSFTDMSTVSGGIIAGWDWNFADTASGSSNTSTFQNPSHTFSATGGFAVTEVVYSNHGCADTFQLNLNNYPLNAILMDTVMNDTVNFTSSATGGSPPYIYTLNYGDGSPVSTSPGASSTHVYPNGTYTACLTVTDVNGCTSTTCNTFISVALTTGISSSNNTVLVRISPNPSADGVFTLTTGNTAKAGISVYNIIGKKIMSREITDGKQTIDLSAEANGSYFITIKTEKEVITKKIIISK
jgi:PKD repeat protein